MQTKNIPQGPRNPNGYTEEEIEHALTGSSGSRHLTFRYELLDSQLNRKRDLDNVLSGSVQQQYISEIKRTASFTIRDRGDIDFLHDQIKPYCRLWMPPRWTQAFKGTDKFWYNSWYDAPVGEHVNSVNSAETGDAITINTGGGAGIQYSTTRFVNSNRSIRMGTATATTHGIRTQFIGSIGDVQMVRGYFFMESGTHLRVRSFGTDGFSYDPASFEINPANAGSTILHQTTFGGDAAQFIGKWVRYEIELHPLSQKVHFRFYWSAPTDILSTPDYQKTFTNANLNRQLGTVVLLHTATAASAGKYTYWGPVELGTLVETPSRPNPTKNDFVEVPLGVFMMASPDRKVSGNKVVTREIEAFDRTQLLLDDKLTEPFVITKGQNYTQVLNTILASYPRIIEPSTWVCGRTRVFNVGTTIKEVVDRIAESINYHTTRFDEEGRLVLRNYVSPGDRTPEYHYTNDQYSIMSPEMEVGFDLSEIHNVWIVSLNEADEDPVYIKLENWDPANPFSIPSRGRKIVDFREEEEGFDRASLMRKAKRIQFEANRQFENISFNTAINPFHSANDCYTMDYGPAGVNNKYTEINWEFNLKAGAEMSHTCRRIVELDPELYPGFVDGHLQVNGAATMSNIKWGATSAFAHIANKPVSFKVTGLGLEGTGPVHVFLTANSAVPGTVRACGVKDRKASGFTIWSWRTNTTATIYYWVAMRDV